MNESGQRLRDEFGDIDIYIFDQLLKGRIAPGLRILDAGCGEGRNIRYLLKHGFDVRGVDESEQAVAAVRRNAAALAPALGGDRFSVQSLEAMTFDDAAFDVVICNAVLHFARDEAHWWRMLRGVWRVLKPGGMFFARLASTIGHESNVTPLGDRRFRMPDGNERFLVDEAYLMEANAKLNARPLEPIKTTVVQATRSMTTWVLEKS